MWDQWVETDPEMWSNGQKEFITVAYEPDA